MIEQARDYKGRFLYKFSVECKSKETSLYFNMIIGKERPIKRFGVVLHNLLKKNGYLEKYERASLNVLEKWDYERMNP
jgi:hypothetical protein